MFKKTAQRGRSERKGKSYYLLYVEPLSDARTKLEVFFNTLVRTGRSGRDQMSSGNRPSDTGLWMVFGPS